MTLEHGASLRYRAVLGGVRILSNRALSGMPRAGNADLEVVVRFTDESEAAMTRPADAHQLPRQMGLNGWISADGTVAVVAGRAGTPTDEAVRGVLPFASALQGAVTLHGSAVAMPSGIHVFIAGSGEGKSTLARQLTASGLPAIADDLTPCRFENGRPFVPVADEEPPYATARDLRGVHFLRRSSAVTCARLTPVRPAHCVEELLKNGFSELESREVWALQFHAYDRIAGTVPSFTLELPDDLSRLAVTAEEVRMALEALEQRGAS